MPLLFTRGNVVVGARVAIAFDVGRSKERSRMNVGGEREKKKRKLLCC